MFFHMFSQHMVNMNCRKGRIERNKRIGEYCFAFSHIRPPLSTKKSTKKRKKSEKNT